MALLANVSLTNTFDTWRTRTNQLVTRINQFAINESSLYANTLTANSSFTSKGLGTFNGRVTIGTNLNVSGNTTIGAAGKVANATGWFGVNGRQSISTNLFVGGNTQFAKSVGIGITPSSWTAALEVGTSGGSIWSNATEYTYWGTNYYYNAGAASWKYKNTGTATQYIHSLGNHLFNSAVSGSADANISWSEKFRIASSGLVTACNSLTVTQNLTVSGNTVLGAAGKTANATGWFGVNGRQSISTNLFVGANTITMGRIGIGTQAPAVKLDIVAAAGAQIQAGDGTVAQFVAYPAGTIAYHGTGSNHPLGFLTNNTQRLNISATGLVTACNSLTVTQNLTVSGNTTIGAAGKTITTTGALLHTGRQTISTNLTVSGNTILSAALLQTGAYAQLGSFNAGTSGNSPAIAYGGVGFSTNISNGQAEANIWNVQDPATYTSTGILLTQYLTSTTRRDLMFLKHNGLVGIGTLSPGYKLDVQGTLGVSTNLTVSGNTTLNGTTTDKSNALSQTLTDGATINWDVSLGRVATVTLGAAGRTMAAPTNLKVGTYILRVYQDATGSRTITTWNSVFKWTAAVAPVLSTGANKLDIITFFSDGTNLYGSYLPDMR